MTKAGQWPVRYRRRDDGVRVRVAVGFAIGNEWVGWADALGTTPNLDNRGALVLE